METITESFDVSGIKRLLIKCPKCGDVIDIPLIDQIYSPAKGEHSIAFECEKCNIEITRKIDIVSTIVTLTIRDPEIVQPVVANDAKNRLIFS
ncbi:MAG: hypothetical protein KAW47_05115 [Thermoplasmatales archaeon]|nr:hypothetical protein [Thermoplasmatales archaeon]